MVSKLVQQNILLIIESDFNFEIKTQHCIMKAVTSQRFYTFTSSLFEKYLPKHTFSFNEKPPES